MAKKKKKTSKIKCDLVLSQFLIDHGFDRGDMSGIIGNGLAYAGKKSEEKKHVNLIKREQQIGCIVILPAQGFFEGDPDRADWTVLFWSPFSSDEIRKRVALKAFL